MEEAAQPPLARAVAQRGGGAILESPGQWVAGAFIFRRPLQHGRGCPMSHCSTGSWQLPAGQTTNTQANDRARRVRINGRPAARLKQPLGPKDKIEVADQIHEEQPAKKESGATLRIIYEDADVIVVDKPAGLLTSTVARERRPTLLAMVRAHVAQREARARVGLIHRLDRDASGLLIFSRNDKAYRSLKSQFFRHSVTREYSAVVHGTPTPSKGRIENRLAERADGVVHTTTRLNHGQIAITDFELLKSEAGMSLLRVTLHTGRKHQIRVHLAGRGLPIVGDQVYGPPAHTVVRLMLAAMRLVIQHPRTGKPSEFFLPLPREFPIQS